MEPWRKKHKISLYPILVGLMILIPFLFAAGCTGNPPEPAELHLTGTEWTLMEYIYNSTHQQVIPGTTVTLSFREGGRISGSSGCNLYSGNYELEGSTITIEEVSYTLIGCLDPVMRQEGRYLSLLSDAVSVTVGDDTLKFADTHGNTILSFKRMVPPEPEPLIGTNWTLKSFHTQDAVMSLISGTTITAVFDKEGRMTSSAGCNQYFGSYALDGDLLSLDTISSTKMYCQGLGIMPQEATYLESLRRVTGFTINGNRLSLVDTNGSTLLSFIAKT